MTIKTKRDSFKENIKNSVRSRIKYSNGHRLKSIKTVKKSVNIKYVSKKLNTEYGKRKLIGRSGTKKQTDNHIRTQTMLGNISANAKDPLRGKEDNRQPDMGIQAVLYASDKIDTAADVIYSSKRVIYAIRGTKNIADSVRGKNSIDKRLLIRQLSVEGAKSGLRTAKNINTQISNQFQSEDTDIGIRGFAEAEKEIRKTYDTAIAIKQTSTDLHKNIKTGKYFKDKIYAEKSRRYDEYKNNVIRSNKFNQKVKNEGSTKRAMYRPNKIKTNRPTVKGTMINSKIAAFSKISVEVAERVVMFFLPGKQTMLLIFVGIAIVILVVNSSSSGMITALSQQYFMTDNNIAQKYQEKVDLLDNKLEKEIRELAADGRYDDVDIIYIGDIQGINTNFQEIFAAAAVKYEQDLTFSAKEESFAEELYEKLYDIEVTSEVYQETDSNGEEVDKIRKIITVYAYDIDTVMSKMGFDEEQKSWTRRLVLGFGEQFPEFAQQYGELTEGEIRELMENAPKLSSSRQQKLYDTALSIIGKVKYFWGGKSAAGWNDDWGKKTKVTAKGSDTTGTYRPFGLDCSGYVDWVYKTAGIGNMLSGGGTAYQFGQSYPIRADDLQVGDLAFLQMPNSSGINHVGIYVGKDKDDNNLYAHCEWGTGVTVNSFKGFKYFRRVVNFEME